MTSIHPSIHPESPILPRPPSVLRRFQPIFSSIYFTAILSSSSLQLLFQASLFIHGQDAQQAPPFFLLCSTEGRIKILFTEIFDTEFDTDLLHWETVSTWVLTWSLINHFISSSLFPVLGYLWDRCTDNDLQAFTLTHILSVILFTGAVLFAFFFLTAVPFKSERKKNWLVSNLKLIGNIHPVAISNGSGVWIFSFTFPYDVKWKRRDGAADWVEGAKKEMDSEWKLAKWTHQRAAKGRNGGAASMAGKDK